MNSKSKINTESKQDTSWRNVIYNLRNKVYSPVLKRYTYKKILFGSKLEENRAGNLCSYAELREVNYSILDLLTKLEYYLLEKDNTIKELAKSEYAIFERNEDLVVKNKKLQNKILKLTRTFFLLSMTMLSIIIICSAAIIGM